MNGLVARMLRSATVGRLFLRSVRKAFEKHGSIDTQNIYLTVLDFIQTTLMHVALDINTELKQRVMALQLLKELDLTSTNINLLNTISESKQEHRKLRRLAKRIVKKNHSKPSRCANTFI